MYMPDKDIKSSKKEDLRILDPIIGPFVNKREAALGPGPISPASLLDDDDKPDEGEEQ